MVCWFAEITLSNCYSVANRFFVTLLADVHHFSFPLQEWVACCTARRRYATSADSFGCSARSSAEPRSTRANSWWDSSKRYLLFLIFFIRTHISLISGSVAFHAVVSCTQYDSLLYLRNRVIVIFESQNLRMFDSCTLDWCTCNSEMIPSKCRASYNRSYFHIGRAKCSDNESDYPQVFISYFLLVIQENGPVKN